MIDIGIKLLHPEALIPTRATPGSVGWDVYALHKASLYRGEARIIRTGIQLVLPPGWEAQIRPRSGMAAKYGVTVLNAPATIDPDYQGEVHVNLVNHGTSPFFVEPGMRIAQLVFQRVEQVVLVPTEEVQPPTERGAGGLGSSGR